MTVTVIVPVSRNAEPWLSQALASIATQTYKDIQLIVETDPRGTGPAATRNRGLSKTDGEHVAFCDADDYLAPGAIRCMVDALGDSEMVVGSFKKFGSFDMVVSHETNEMDMGMVADYVMLNLINPRSHQMLSGCWAKLYLRDLIGEFPEHLTTAEDMAFNFDYLRSCNSVVFLSDIVYNNRKHNGSLTTTFDEKNKHGLFGVLQGLAYVEKFLEGYYTEDEIRRAVDNSRVYHSALYFTRICAHTGKPMNDVFTSIWGHP